MVLLIRPCLCCVSWLLGSSSLLLSVCSSGVESPGAHGAGVKGPGAPSPVNGIRGGSVCFHVVLEPGAQLNEIMWTFISGSSTTHMLRIQQGQEHAPIWLGLQDKYRQRVHVPNITSLRIENLTREDSGLYGAQIILSNGTGITQTFLLTVYEPVTPPEILIESQTITTDWCNVTLLCRATGPMEDLTVTWESKDLPRELDLNGTQGLDMHSRTLAVSLPGNQPSASVSCVASNPVDQKTATKSSGELCVLGPAGQKRAVLSRVIPCIVMAVLLVLIAGLILWKRRGKKKKKTMNSERAQTPAPLRDDSRAGFQEDRKGHGGSVHYAELIPKGTHGQGDHEKQPRQEQPVNTIYSEVHAPGQAPKRIQ